MAKKKVNTSQALFTDFSAGLYLLDTPRGYGEQLTSLALTGGRNVWSEKGALIPQYGYDVKATIPDNEKVLLISDDDESSSSVFIVTQDVETSKGNVYLYTASEGLKKYKTQIPSITTPIVSARTGTNLILTTAGVNYEFGAYYPESVEETIDEDLTISTYTSYYETVVPETSKDYYWAGREIAIKSDGKTVPVKVVSVTSDISETTRNNIKGKQILEGLEEGKSYKFSFNFTLTDIDNNKSLGELFYGTALENCSFTYYAGGSTLYPKPTLRSKAYSSNSADTIIDITDVSFQANTEYTVVYEVNNKNVLMSVYEGDKFLSSEISYVMTGIVACLNRDKIIRDYITLKENGIIISETVIEKTKLRLVTQQGTQHTTLTGTVSLVERTINTLTFKYIPEEVTESNPERVITPDVMGFCANRLCISDIGGVIYYSGVGVVDNFDESLGAGFFEGFSDDNSKCLCLEDYYNGVLITKQNGLYFLAFGTDSTNSVTTSATIGISIKKIAQIGQQYAKDHVIIDKQIIAYDSNSASILVAASVNIFGSLVAGKTLVTAEELNAQSFGIPEQRRQLLYNSEARVLILYYGEQLKNGIIYVPQSKAIFPREMDVEVEDYQGFNQGVIAVSEDGKIFQDFKKGTLIEGLTSIVNFEPIGLRDNRMICASVMEISELNSIEYDLTVTNTQTSLQHITPSSSVSSTNKNTPPMLYSDKKANLGFDAYSMQRKWADKTSNCTRVYAPMSGKYGVNLGFEFPKAEAFCLAAILINDFSQGG